MKLHLRGDNYHLRIRAPSDLVSVMTRRPFKNILFASEMLGAVKGIDPTTGHNYHDTKRYIDATPHLNDDEK